MAEKEILWSKLKPAEKFLRKWEELGFLESSLHREYLFHPVRKWRFDFAWPELFVAIEVQGFGFGHQSIVGLKKDCEKMRAAIQLGWFVIPFSSACLGSHEKCEDAVEYVCGVLELANFRRKLS